VNYWLNLVTPDTVGAQWRLWSESIKFCSGVLCARPREKEEADNNGRTGSLVY